MKKIINKIEEILSAKPNAVIAIDGCCASGKTTLAAELAERFDLQIIHMDDFFLLPEMRTAERLSQPGGNVHYERFTNEVAAGIKSGREFRYRIFSCKKGAFDGEAAVNPQKPIIVEGAYTLHPEIPDIFDFKIFIEADLKTRLERIENRNGKDGLEIFKNKWIPLEDRYFEAFDIRNKCDYTMK